MGINRLAVVCGICAEEFALRISVSMGPQSHMFNCPKCDSSLSLKYHIRDLLKRDIIEVYDGCAVGSKYESVKMINLHPDFPIPKKELYNSKFSVNIYMMDLASQHLEDHNDLEGIVDGDAVLEGWKEVKVNWDLFDNKKYDLLKNRIPNTVQESDIQVEFYDYLSRFISFCHLQNCATPWNKKYEQSLKELTSENKSEFRRFLEFHNKELFVRNLNFYKTAILDFFSGFSDLKQVRLMAKLGIPTKGHVISSVDFETTKKVYGNLFEILDKTFNAVPLMQKIFENGKFDHFESISIDNYIKSSISNKLQNLNERNFSFSIPSEEIINNRIRNASHHSTIFYDKKSQEVSCVDKDKKLNINYLVYLTKCTHLMNYIFGMMMIDLELNSIWKSEFGKSK